MTATLSFHEINDINDDLFPAWLDAIQMGFPPDEQMLASFFIQVLKRKVGGEQKAESYHMIAVVDDTAKLAGILMYQMIEEIQVCYLWYIWVDESRRSQGIGSTIYNYMAQQSLQKISDLCAIVYEIDRPDQAGNEQERIEANRRIDFYKRKGCKIATNITYYQSVGRRDQPSKLMYLCIHPFKPLTDQQVYDIFANVFGEDIETADILNLE